MGITYLPGITIRSAPGIPKATREAVGALVKWLRRSQRVADGLIVYLRPEPVVGNGGGIGFAAIQSPKIPHDPERPLFLWMPVGAGFVELAQEEWGQSAEEAMDGLLHNILHEFAHYEQWRDGKKVQERGVNVRATSLLNRYRESTHAG